MTDYNEKHEELTDSEKKYFKSRIDFKGYRYWTGGIPLRTKKVILEALRIGCVVSVKSRTSSLFYTLNTKQTRKED